MEIDPYIKLSRSREDYGLDGRQGTSLHMSELDSLTPAQLTQLRTVLQDECQDIQHQINLELKRCEKDSRWMYGCKNSLKAHLGFINKITEILGDGEDTEFAAKFVQAAKKILAPGTYATIVASVQGKDEVFTVMDL